MWERVWGECGEVCWSVVGGKKDVGGCGEVCASLWGERGSVLRSGEGEGRCGERYGRV